ncbi:MAG: helicase-associated domain-containing protein, partial [Anaerolineae bacterium]
LYLMWSAARESPFQLTNAGLLRATDVKRVAGQLLVSETYATGSKESDFRRIFFLRRLLMALGLLATGQGADANTLTVVPKVEFWESGATERVRACYQSWRDGAWWHELWAAYEQGATRASGSVTDFAPQEVVKARRVVLDTLANFARRGMEWIPFDRISDHLRDHDEEFLIDRETAEHYYGSYRYYYTSRATVSPYQQNRLNWSWDKYAADPEAGWDGVEAVFIRAVLTEGLYWLGLVDLGYLRPVTAAGGAAPDGLQAVRLTDMGRWLLLGAEPPAIPAESGRVVVQPNFRIFAFDPISDAVLARLDSFATRLNAERAIEYELTAASVYRAQQAGQKVSDIIRWLEEVTAAPLPQNILRSLAEWEAAFERIVIRPRVGWVQTATAELADQLMADPTLRETIIKRAGATSLMVHADKVDLIERRLLAAGELPVRTSNVEEAHKASIILSADGAIRFVHPTPNLYVFGHLFPLADQTADGWRITAQSVRRANAAGLDAPRIIARLETLALGEVPAELQVRIKAWSKYYGDAIVQTLTLVQFRDQSVVNELCADPVLSAYMRPFKPTAGLGLALVRPADVVVLRGLLAERGIELIES